MKRYELEDHDWERIRGFLPEAADTGRPKRIDRELWCVDSTMVRASHVAAGAGKKKGLRSR